MDDNQRNVLISSSVWLRKDLTVNDGLLAYLTSQRILETKDADSINFTESGRERLAEAQVDRLLELLPGRGKTAFSELCNGLTQSELAGNSEVAEKLRRSAEGEDAVLEEDCTRMDGYMRRIAPQQRKDLLGRAESMSAHRSTKVKIKDGKHIQVPRPLDEVVINTLALKIPEGHVASLVQEIERVTRFAGMIKHRQQAAPDLKLTNQETHKGGDDPEEMPKREPCFVNISNTHHQADGEAMAQVESYLKDLKVIDAKTKVIKGTRLMPVPVMELHGGDRLHSYGCEGSVLVKLTTDITTQRPFQYKKLERGILDHLKELLTGEELYLQASHAQDDGRVLLVEMSAGSFQSLYQLSVEQPGILASISVVSISTVDGATTISTQSTEDHTSFEQSPEEANLIERFLSTQTDIDEEDQRSIAEQPTFQLALMEYGELMLEKQGSAKKLLEMAKGALKGQEDYKRWNSIFTGPAARWKIIDGADNPLEHDCQEEQLAESAITSSTVALADTSSTVTSPDECHVPSAEAKSGRAPQDLENDRKVDSSQQPAYGDKLLVFGHVAPLTDYFPSASVDDSAATTWLKDSESGGPADKHEKAQDQGEDGNAMPTYHSPAVEDDVVLPPTMSLDENLSASRTDTQEASQDEKDCSLVAVDIPSDAEVLSSAGSWESLCEEGTLLAPRSPNLLEDAAATVAEGGPPLDTLSTALPPSMLANAAALEHKPWFCGCLEQSAAREKLKSVHSGFLVHYSKRSEGQFILTIKRDYQVEIGHLTVSQIESSSQFTVGQGVMTFPTISALVAHHLHNPVVANDGSSWDLGREWLSLQDKEAVDMPIHSGTSQLSPGAANANAKAPLPGGFNVILPLEDQPWYRGSSEWHAVKTLLDSAKVGDYLVRYSKVSGQYVLCFKSKREPTQIRIVQRQQKGKFFFSLAETSHQCPFFPDIPEMVLYHVKHDVLINSNERVYLVNGLRCNPHLDEASNALPAHHYSDPKHETPSSSVPVEHSRAPLEDQPWYHGSLSRKGADEKLCNASAGDFLVRDSASSPGDYALSFREVEGVKHYKIERVLPEGKFRTFTPAMTPWPLFASIPELVENLLNRSIKIRQGDQVQPTRGLLVHHYDEARHHPMAAIPSQSHRSTHPDC